MRAAVTLSRESPDRRRSVAGEGEAVTGREVDVGASIPWVKLYPRDWVSDPRYADLPLAAQAVFCNLVFHFIARGGQLPDDRKVLARCAHASDSEFADAWDLLTRGHAPLFQKADDGTWFNARAQVELAAAMKKTETNRTNGSKGGRPPKKPRTKPNGLAKPKPNAEPKPEPRTKGNSELRSQNPEPRSKIKTPCPLGRCRGGPLPTPIRRRLLRGSLARVAAGQATE